ncbi:hypothetical protein B0I35DRAFT_422971 [Stachybotrys elegans]|uniref:Uncharacterized protein n=1 Tax=Stachybotrys elegans TaxID=80388 RepID=A0A8K0WWI3_9HYPO|nr:hypothetical protein B0I35DRAFT_422971 [Stachybotrys elegans]
MYMCMHTLRFAKKQTNSQLLHCSDSPQPSSSVAPSRRQPYIQFKPNQAQSSPVDLVYKSP